MPNDIVVSEEKETVVSDGDSSVGQTPPASPPPLSSFELKPLISGDAALKAGESDITAQFVERLPA